MKFVSLHTHTTTSYGDGFGTMSQHVARVAELGHDGSGDQRARQRQQPRGVGA